MKTGNILSKYYSYSIIWANKILANIKGYSIDKAYEISPVFASMVQSQLDNYQQQLDRLKYTAMVFGVFDECKSMFDNFYKTCKKDIQLLMYNPKKVKVEVWRDVGYYDYHQYPHGEIDLEASHEFNQW